MIRRQQHVTGVRIGVKEAVDDDLMQVGPKQLARQPARVEVLAQQRRERGDLLSLDQFHGEHARTGVVGDRRGHDNAPERGEVPRDAHEIARFALVIQFLRQRAAELRHHLDEVELLPGTGVLIEKSGDVLHRREIQGKSFANIRPLHLDGNTAAVPKFGAMHLPERRRRDRLHVECGEAFRQAHSEIVLNDALDLRERKRLDPILETAQGVQIGRRQQIGARREHLTELDECGAEPLEIRRQFLRLGICRPMSGTRPSAPRRVRRA